MGKEKSEGAGTIRTGGVGEKKPPRTRYLVRGGLVETEGFEPLTSRMRTERSTN